MFELRLSPNSKKLLEKLNNMRKETAKAVYNAAKVIGKATKKEMRRLLTTESRSGRLYRYTKTTKQKTTNGEVVFAKKSLWHRASAPGEAPAKFTGKLSKSIHYKTSKYGVQFSIKTKYARKLEEGPVGRPHEARPYAMRTIRKMKNRNIRTLERYIINRNT